MMRVRAARFYAGQRTAREFTASVIGVTERAAVVPASAIDPRLPVEKRVAIGEAAWVDQEVGRARALLLAGNQAVLRQPRVNLDGIARRVEQGQAVIAAGPVQRHGRDVD